MTPTLMLITFTNGMAFAFEYPTARACGDALLDLPAIVQQLGYELDAALCRPAHDVAA